MAFKIFFIFAFACIILAEENVDLGRILALGEIEPFLTSNQNPEKIRNCYLSSTKLYKRTVQKFYRELNTAADNFQKYFENEDQKLVQGVQNNLRKIADLMAKYPIEMKKLIKAEKFKDATYCLRDTKKSVNWQSDKAIEGMLKLRDLNFNNTRKAGKELDVVQENIETVTKNIITKFTKCMNEESQNHNYLMNNEIPVKK